MDTRKVLMLLAVGVLMSGLSGVAVADDQGMLTYEAADYSRSADPSWPAAQTDTSQTDPSQIREPVDTGAVPMVPESMSDQSCCGSQSFPVEEIGSRVFRPGLDDGP
jgi:hypothetical protein